MRLFAFFLKAHSHQRGENGFTLSIFTTEKRSYLISIEKIREIFDRKLQSGVDKWEEEEYKALAFFLLLSAATTANILQSECSDVG